MKNLLNTLKNRLGLDVEYDLGKELVKLEKFYTKQSLSVQETSGEKSFSACMSMPKESFEQYKGEQIVLNSELSTTAGPERFYLCKNNKHGIVLEHVTMLGKITYYRLNVE